MFGRLAFLGAFLVGCAPTGSFEGKLVDAISGDVMEGVRILAKSPDATDLTCQVFEATSDAGGIFKLDGLCANAKYDVTTGDNQFLIDGLGQLEGGIQSAGVIDVKVWRAPGTGVYILDGKDLKKQATKTDVKSKVIFESENELAYYPMETFEKLTKIEENQYLVLSGERNVSKMKFYPLVPEPNERKFGNKTEWTTEGPWTYIGIKFTSNTEYERLENTPDPSKVLKAGEGERQLLYIKGGALPAGDYAVMADKDRRTYMFKF